MAINQQANLTVTLNNEQAKRELAELQAEMKRLIDLRDKAQQAGDLKLYKQLDAQLKKATREARNYEKQLADVNTVLKNLSGASINELRKAQQTLTAQTARLNRETTEYAQKTAQLKMVRDELSRIQSETRSVSSRMERMANTFNNYFQIIAAGAAAFAGLVKALETSQQDPGAPVLVLCTGSGLKDINAAIRSVPAAPVIEPTIQALKKVIYG